MAENLNPVGNPVTLQSPVTIPVVLVRGLLGPMQARDQSYDKLLADAGIAAELLWHSGARVTATQYATLFRLVIEHLGDESLGYLSRPLKPGCFALMARCALSAQTLEIAIRRAMHAFWLFQDDVSPELRREGNSAGLVFRFANPGVAKHLFLHELLMRVLWRLIAWLAGGRLPVTRFDFSYERPSHAASYAKLFPAQLEFGQQQTAFWFDVTWLREPVHRDEAALRNFLANALTNILVPRRADEIVSTRVRSHLQRSQPLWPDLAAAAGSLHISIKTLQRRLAIEGTSFQTLKDELRRDMAIVRLNSSSVPLAQIAQELGFTDSAAFQRAFKNWTGTAPGTYRRSKTVK